LKISAARRTPKIKPLAGGGGGGILPIGQAR